MKIIVDDKGQPLIQIINDAGFLEFKNILQLAFLTGAKAGLENAVLIMQKQSLINIKAEAKEFSETYLKVYTNGTH